MPSKVYRIKPGQKNFRPYEPVWPIWKPGGFTISGKFLPGGWCSEEEWSFIDENGNRVVDKDRTDQQKIGGITNFFSANHKQTAMFAFSFGNEQETYNIVPYTNPRKGGFVKGDAMLVEAGEEWFLNCGLEGNKAIYRMVSEGNKSATQDESLRRFKVGRRVGTYAGGANNSPGPFGGKAIKAMAIEIDFKAKK